MTIGWVTVPLILLILLRPSNAVANEFILTQIGSNFTLDLTQYGENHLLTFDVNGDFGSSLITQTGADKTMILDFEGTPHNFIGTQTGAGNHYVFIDIETDSDDTAQISSIQTGNTSMSYSITGSCWAATGCALTIFQDGN